MCSGVAGGLPLGKGKGGPWLANSNVVGHAAARMPESQVGTLRFGPGNGEPLVGLQLLEVFPYDFVHVGLRLTRTAEWHRACPRRRDRRCRRRSRVECRRACSCSGRAGRAGSAYRLPRCPRDSSGSAPSVRRRTGHQLHETESAFGRHGVGAEMRIRPRRRCGRTRDGGRACGRRSRRAVPGLRAPGRGDRGGGRLGLGGYVLFLFEAGDQCGGHLHRTVRSKQPNGRALGFMPVGVNLEAGLQHCVLARKERGGQGTG